MNTAIHINSLSKAYLNKSRGTTSSVLNGISCSIEKGKTIGIVGQNGCGKTTLLRIIAGLTKPSQGTVSICGKVIAIIELGSGFHPDLSGFENIKYYAQILGFKATDVKPYIESIVAFSEIGDYIHEPVKAYSKGMFLRLAYSIVVHLDADIYLFDEVFVVGDAYFKEKCIKSLLELKAKGKTILITGHDYELINSVCDDFIEIENGNIKENKNDRHSITDVIALDNTITLGQCTFLEKETHYEFDVVLEQVHDYARVDVMLIMGFNENSAIRFVVDCHQGHDGLLVNEQFTCKAKISVEKKYFNLGYYSVSLAVIKNRSVITRNYAHCLTFNKNEDQAEGIDNHYPGPIRLFGQVQPGSDNPVF